MIDFLILIWCCGSLSYCVIRTVLRVRYAHSQHRTNYTLHITRVKFYRQSLPLGVCFVKYEVTLIGGNKKTTLNVMFTHMVRYVYIMCALLCLFLCVCVCVCVCIHTCIHKRTYIHTYINTYIHTQAYTPISNECTIR